jgi:hypothetical protein
VQFCDVIHDRTSLPSHFDVYILTLPVCIIHTNTLTTSTPYNSPALLRFHGLILIRVPVSPYPLKPASFRVSWSFESILDHAPILAVLCYTHMRKVLARNHNCERRSCDLFDLRLSQGSTRGGKANMLTMTLLSLPKIGAFWNLSQTIVCNGSLCYTRKVRGRNDLRVPSGIETLLIFFLASSFSSCRNDLRVPSGIETCCSASLLFGQSAVAMI